MAVEIEEAVLTEIGQSGEISDTGAFAESLGFDHRRVAGVALSLESTGLILKRVRELKGLT